MIYEVKGFVKATVFGLILVIVGFLWLSALNEYMDHYDELDKTGHKVVGQVVDVSYETIIRRDDSTTHRHTSEILEISYDIDGKTYTINEEETFVLSQKGTKVGSDINVLVDKDNPSDAMSERENLNAENRTKKFIIGIIVVGSIFLINATVSVIRGNVF